ncbi:hypothetical protein [Hansschlegelia zhihuaiae]|uniref:Uncharacterized protein n=1 Tax=Hansschlegelia zhihuaiae TaxID=405005 RepID=A0A4Q0MJ85_9HYPH|nr:hypothetical protein [Hansschlegelia zhihuaiae]RXF73443.1 hypothetical protein EK403_09585 [Hansschlegelia zhihuaiae]
MTERRQTIDSAAMSLYDDRGPRTAERRGERRTARRDADPEPSAAGSPDPAERAKAWRAVLLGDLLGFLLVSSAAIWSAAPLML